MRKNNTKPTPVESTRLARELIETFQTKMNNSKDPRIEEVQIPREIARWEPTFPTLAGVNVPGRDMANHFAIELARGVGAIPSYTPFATGDLSADPWVPTDPAFARAQYLWGGECKPPTNDQLTIPRHFNFAS